MLKFIAMTAIASLLQFQVKPPYQYLLTPYKEIGTGKNIG